MMNRVDRLKTSGVAPHAGAWIETVQNASGYKVG